jgi:hypothetical protein
MTAEPNGPGAGVSGLLEALRHELRQYGEMLALQEQQQEAVLHRGGGEVMRCAALINNQMGQVRTAREARGARQAELARELRQPEAAECAALIPLLAPKFRLPVDSLVRENRCLFSRIRARARQNHLLLSRSLQFMQEFLSALAPQAGASAAGGETGSIGSEIERPRMLGIG